MHPTGFLPQRQLILIDLIGLLLGVRPGERALVAIDGVDGVGKTHLTRELLALADLVAGREVLSVSIDGFHRPRADRMARGTGPESFYQDSYDYEAFRAAVVEPFRAGREIRPAVFDVARDEAVHPDPIEPSEDAVLIVEGIFLRRPELASLWDASLYVKADFEVTVPRGNARFPDRADGSDDSDDPDHPSNARYVGGQKLYLQQARLAPPTWIVDNTDLQRPLLEHPDPDDPNWFS